MTKSIPMPPISTTLQALHLPQRSKKPRRQGITAIIDVGLPLAQQAQILESYHPLLDLAKLGTAAAYINPVLREKITLYKDFGIPVCFGGTLFEKYASQNKLAAYKTYLQDLDVHCVEVSSGILDIPQNQLIEIAADFKTEFTVIAEVGKKFGALSHQDWLEAIQAYFDVGVDTVILEGRSSANAGIYDANGRLDSVLMDKIGAQFNTDKLWFEAANIEAQTQLITIFGSNVNISNVRPQDLVSLEALRLGLRAETFNITEQ